MSRFTKGQHPATEFKKGHIPWIKGKKHSEETKKKIGLASKGRTVGMKGKHHSEETKQKISKATKGRHLSPNFEFKKGYQPWNKGIKTGIKPWLGKKRSPETVKKMSEGMKGKFSGSKHWHWKGGFLFNKGYCYILKHNHPFCNNLGYIKRSRFIMEQMIGRYLSPKEVTHHINKVKDDDRPENLKLFPNNSEHMKSHFSSVRQKREL